MSVSTVLTDTIYLGFNPTSQCQSAQFPQISYIWALTNQPISVSTVPTDTIYLGFNPTSQCQSAQFPHIPSIWALTNQAISVSTVLTDTIYLGFNPTIPICCPWWHILSPSNPTYHLSLQLVLIKLQMSRFDTHIAITCWFPLLGGNKWSVCTSAYCHGSIFASQLLCVISQCEITSIIILEL